MTEVTQEDYEILLAQRENYNMKEEWKSIEGYADYEVSNHGRVKSRKRLMTKILKEGIYSGKIE